MNLRKFVVINLLYIAILPATAQSYDNQAEQDTSQNTQNIANYLQNWAAYLGYSIANAPTNTPTEASTQLVDLTSTSLAETYLYGTFFGSIPTVTPPNSSTSTNSTNSGTVGNPFVPSSESGASLINSESNLTFKNYNNTDTKSTAPVTANSLIDQPPFQSDPVSQSIYNILSTPDVSYCTDSKGVVSNPTNPNADTDLSSCTTLGSIMSQSQVVENVTGEIPGSSDFYTFAQNSNVLPQLNSNSLIAPLSYSTEANSTNTSTSSSGLISQNQVQQATNFIRYVSGSVIPTILPNLNAYQTLYIQAHDKSDKGQASAQAILSSYLTSLRVYAAQTSVGMGNLYYILSRRLPQQSSSTNGDNTTLPSQALNEYNMATWRIFNPATSANGTQNQQWIDKINSATPTTVQKEMAILLSEINYQLYLNRQIQERMLFTQSVTLLQGTKAGQPSADLSNQNTTASSGTSSSTEEQ